MDFPDAEKIVLVVDNLNTHAIGALYKAFPAEQARQLQDKLEMHYTPKHGSWLKRQEMVSDERLAKVEWRVSERAGKARSLERRLYKDALNCLEWVGQPMWDAFAAYLKSKVRSKVEHNFYIVKRVFGFLKVAIFYPFSGHFVGNCFNKNRDVAACFLLMGN